MTYLIVSKSFEPFLTTWFDAENNFNKDDEMIVFNISQWTYTTDGKIWHDIKTDHL